MNWFQCRDDQLSSKIARRKDRLKQLLKEHNPSLVVCYGSSLAKEFAELLNADWRPIRPRVCASPNCRRLLFRFLGKGGIGHKVVQDLIDDGILGNGGKGAKPTP